MSFFNGYVSLSYEKPKDKNHTVGKVPKIQIENP
jgi:hypothetical protein